MLSHLQLLFRQTLFEIADELGQDEQKALKFLCADQLSASDREGKGLENMLQVFEKLTHIDVISCDQLEGLRQWLKIIKRPDLIKKKVDAFEFKRELLFVLDAYVALKKRSGTKADRPSTEIAKRLVEETEGKIHLSELLTKNGEAGLNINRIVDRFIDKTVAKKPTTWATVATLIVFGGEVVVCASELERANRLKNVAQTLAEYLTPWVSKHGGWTDFSGFIEDRYHSNKPEAGRLSMADDVVEKIAHQFEESKLFG